MLQLSEVLQRVVQSQATGAGIRMHKVCVVNSARGKAS